MTTTQTLPATQHLREAPQHGRQLKPASDLVHYLREYTRERPEVVALWCLGVGIILGWKLKPW